MNMGRVVLVGFLSLVLVTVVTVTDSVAQSGGQQDGQVGGQSGGQLPPVPIIDIQSISSGTDLRESMVLMGMGINDLNKKVVNMDTRLRVVEDRLQSVEGRVIKIETEVKNIGGHIKRLDGRIDRMDNKMDTEFKRLNDRMDNMLYWFVGGIMSVIVAFGVPVYVSFFRSLKQTDG